MNDQEGGVGMLNHKDGLWTDACPRTCDKHGPLLLLRTARALTRLCHRERPSPPSASRRDIVGPQTTPGDAHVIERRVNARRSPCHAAP
jgi:hypothetical protein